jgi:pimeloyl-ACP methyl ester carboxylesterase
MPASLLSPMKSTNVRTLWSQLAGRWLGEERAADGAARDVLTPPRRVAPPMLPEPAGPALRVAVPDWPAALAVRAWGEGAPVLLVHDWGASMRELDGVAAALAARGMRAIALDLPGHGRSAGARCHVALAAEALLAVGRRLGPLQGVFGHGFGAAAVMLALDQGLRAGRAVLLEPPADTGDQLQALAEARGLGPHGTAALLRRVGQEIGRPLAGLALAGIAGRLRLPALLLHGAGPQSAPLPVAEGLCARWQGASLHRLGGGGPEAPHRPGVQRLAAWFLAGGGPVRLAPPSPAKRPMTAGTAAQ